MDRFARYAWFTLAYNVAVILWGAIVRATGSGAGCGAHWPLCNGTIVQRAPTIGTIIELSHRATSGIALVLVLGLAGWAFRARPKGHGARKAALFSLGFMLSEAAVGAGLVLFRLVADNESMARAMFMATHLVNTFLLLGAMTLTAHFASGGAPFRIRGVRSQGALGGGIVLTLLGILVAGVSGAVAALGDTLFPATSLAKALAADLSPTGHLLVRLRLLHPGIAVAVGLLAFVQAWRWRDSGSPAAARLAGWTCGLVFLQILAGVLNVGLLAPVWMQVVHLLLADLLWIVFLLLGATVLALAYSKAPPRPLPISNERAPAPASPLASVSAPSRASALSPSASGRLKPS